MTSRRPGDRGNFKKNWSDSSNGDKWKQSISCTHNYSINQSTWTFDAVCQDLQHHVNDWLVECDTSAFLMTCKATLTVHLLSGLRGW